MLVVGLVVLFVVGDSYFCPIIHFLFFTREFHEIGRYVMPKLDCKCFVIPTGAKICRTCLYYGCNIGNGLDTLDLVFFIV